MIKNILILCLLALGLSSFNSAKKGDPSPPMLEGTSAGVQFIEGGWFEAAEAAKAQGKPIFAFVWSTNCLESVRMLEDNFTDQEIGTFFNENFVNYKIDGNDLKNNMRVSNWGVTGLPTLVFLTPKRKVILMKKGKFSNEELIKTAKIALKKM